MNGHRMKLYQEKTKSVHKVIEEYYLDEVSVIKRTALCRNVK